MSKGRLVIDSYAEITIRVCEHYQDAERGVVYQHRQRVPVEYFSDTRYHGYISFQFQEMYEHMVRTLKEAA